MIKFSLCLAPKAVIFNSIRITSIFPQAQSARPISAAIAFSPHLIDYKTMRQPLKMCPFAILAAGYLLIHTSTLNMLTQIISLYPTVSVLQPTNISSQCKLLNGRTIIYVFTWDFLLHASLSILGFKCRYLHFSPIIRSILC